MSVAKAHAATRVLELLTVGSPEHAKVTEYIQGLGVTGADLAGYDKSDPASEMKGLDEALKAGEAVRPNMGRASTIRQEINERLDPAAAALIRRPPPQTVAKSDTEKAAESLVAGLKASEGETSQTDEERPAAATDASDTDTEGPDQLGPHDDPDTDPA